MPIRRISAELIDEVCGSIRSLAVLNLSHNDIATIENLERLTALTRLDLSHNRIALVSGLSTLHRLTHLSLASNRIRLITGMEQLHSLETLLLADNLIEAPAHVRTLAWLPVLHSLTLAGNPLATDTRHRTDVSGLLPRLRFLDGEAVHPGGPAQSTPLPQDHPTSSPSAGTARPSAIDSPSLQAAAVDPPSSYLPTAGSPSGGAAAQPLGAPEASPETPYLRMSSELLAAHREAEIGSRCLRAAVPHAASPVAPVGGQATDGDASRGHLMSGSAPLESAETVWLRTALAAEQRAHAACGLELEAVRRHLTQAREERAAASAELERSRATFEAQLAQARALLDAERLTARQLRAYIGSVAARQEEAGHGEGGGAGGQTLAPASQQAQAAAAVRERDAAEALRVEKELLQMRLDAMVSLLDVQEQTITAALGAANAASVGEAAGGDAAGGAAGGACGMRNQSKGACPPGDPDDDTHVSALQGALQTLTLHPGADAMALLAMVHGWRQKAFELLMRAQNERRDRKRTSAHLEAELARARAGLAGNVRACDAAAAREAAAVATLAAERASRRRAEVELASTRRALEASRAGMREAEACSRALVRAVQRDLPALMLSAEGAMRAVGDRLGPLEARLRFGLQRIGVLAVLKGEHTQPRCHRPAPPQPHRKGERVQAGLEAPVRAPVLVVPVRLSQAPPAAAPLPPTGGSPRSTDVLPVSATPRGAGTLQAGESSGLHAHVEVEMARLLDERSVLLRRIDGWAAAEAARAEAAAELAEAAVREAETGALAAWETARTAQGEVAELRRALETEQARAMAGVAAAQAAAETEREAAAEARREASATRARGDDSRLVLQQAVSSLQAELLRTRDELERNSRLSAQVREDAAADREALRGRMEQAEARHVHELRQARQAGEETAAAAAERASSAATALADQARSSLELELAAARRDSIKAEVARKSLEREVGRLKAQAAEADRVKFEYLEGKLRSKDEMVSTLRKERSSLLAALRREQHQGVSRPEQAEHQTGLIGERSVAELAEGCIGPSPERPGAHPVPVGLVDAGEVGPACHKFDEPGTHTSAGDGCHRRRLISPSKLEELRALSNNLLASV